MYTKPEINKRCYSTSQAFLLCLHCVFILPCGVCSVGGLHFPQHTVISFLGSFPLCIMGVPIWSASRVLRPNEGSRPKKIQVHERRGQQYADRGSVHSNSCTCFFCLQLQTGKLRSLPSPLLHQERCSQGEGLFPRRMNAERALHFPLVLPWMEKSVSKLAGQEDAETPAVLEIAVRSTWFLILCSEQVCWYTEITICLHCCKWNKKADSELIHGLYWSCITVIFLFFPPISQRQVTAQDPQIHYLLFTTRKLNSSWSLQ